MLIGAAMSAGVGLSTGCLRAAPAVAGPDSVISQAELERMPEANAYDAIARSRPMFLRDRGPITARLGTRDVATVFLNDQPLGDLATLRTVSSSDLAEIRYYSSTEAVQRFGASYGGGVIQLRLRK